MQASKNLSSKEDMQSDTDKSSSNPSPEPVKTQVFISYSRKDSHIALRLHSLLQKNSIGTFLDTTDILPGEPWQERLSGIIAGADSVIICLSENWLASDICKWEFNEARDSKKRIFPVLISEIPTSSIPQELSRLNFLMLRQQDNVEMAISSLLQVLTVDIGWIREHTRLGELARRWEEHDEDPHYCLRGNALAHAEDWVEQAMELASRNLTNFHERFIETSRTEADKAASYESAQQNSKLKAQSKLFINLANSSFDNHEYLQAAQTAYEAMPDPARGSQRPYMAEAELALYRAMARLQLTNTQKYPSEVVKIVSASQSHYLVISYREGFLRIIDTRDLSEIGRVDIDGSYATKLAFHPNRAQVAAGTPTGLIILIDLKNLNANVIIRAHDYPIWAMSYSPDGHLIASGATDQTVRVWNLKTGFKQADFLGHPAPVGDITFSPDSQLVASSSFRGDPNDPNCYTVYCWQAKNGELVSRMSGHTAYTTGLAFGLGAQKLVTTSFDETVRLWEVKSGRQLVQKQIKEAPVSLDFHPDRRTFVTVTRDGSITFWKTDDLEEIRGLSNRKIEAASFTADGKSLIALESQGITELIPADGLGTTRYLKLPGGDLQLASAANNGHNLITCDYNGLIGLWRRHPLLIMGVAQLHRDYVSSLCWHPIGKKIVSGCDDGTLALWNPEDNSVWSYTSEQKGEIIGVARSQEGMILVGVYKDGFLVLWDMKTCKVKQEISLSSAELSRSAYCHRFDSLVVADTNNKVWIISIDNPSHPAHLTFTDKILDIQISSHDGSLIVLDDSGKVTIINLESGVRLYGLDLGFEAESFRLAPDGRFLFVTKDAFIMINWETRKEIWSIEKNYDRIVECRFMADGNRFLVYQPRTPSVEIYNSENGECVGSFVAGDDIISAVVHEKDPVVATGLASGYVETWKVFSSPEDTVNYAFEYLPSVSKA